MKRSKVIILASAIALVALLVILLQDGLIDSIQSGELQYSEEAGWINWGHARTDGTKAAFEEFQAKNQSSTEPFKFSYAQRMKIPVFGGYQVAEYKETRMFPSGLSAEQEVAAFFEIFISVTKEFETLQGDYPYAILTRSNSSSFRDGDLIGNLISFLAVTVNKDLDSIKSKLTLLDATESLKQHKLKPIGKVSEWDKIKLNPEDYTAVPMSIRALVVLTSATGLSVKLSGKRNLYYE